MFERDLAAWGWIWLLLGILLIVAGFAVVKGMEWARWFGIVVARRRRHRQLLVDRLATALDAGVGSCIYAAAIYGLLVYGGRRDDFRPGLITASHDRHHHPRRATSPRSTGTRLTADEVCRRLDVDPAVGLSDAEVAERRGRGTGRTSSPRRPRSRRWKAFLRQYQRPDAAGAASARRSSASSPSRTSSTGLVVLGLTVLNAVMGLHQEGKAAESVAALRQMLIMTASVAPRRPARRGPGRGAGARATSSASRPATRCPPTAGSWWPRRSRSRRPGSPARARRSSKGIDPVAGDDVAARRPHRHGVHELAGHPRPRRDGRHGDGDGDRGRPHLRDAERRRAGEDAAHQAARPADGADHDHGGGRAGADRHPRPRPRRGLRHAVPRSASAWPSPPSRPASRPSSRCCCRSAPSELADEGRDRQAAASRSRRSGSTSAICSDKTGTLTLNQMTARAAGRRRPPLQRRRRGLLDRRAGSCASPASGDGPLEPFLLPMALANDAVIRDGACIGDPTEGALVVLAAKGGLDVEETRRTYPARRRGAVRRRVQADGDVPRDGRRRPARSCAASSRARPTCCSPGRRATSTPTASSAPMDDATATGCWPRTTGWPARACACSPSPGATSTRRPFDPAATCSALVERSRAARPRRHRRPAAQGGQGRHRALQGRRHPRPDDHRRPRHDRGRDRRPARHRGPGAHRRRVRGDVRRAAARRGRRASASSPASRPRTRCAWSASSRSRGTSSP